MRPIPTPHSVTIIFKGKTPPFKAGDVVPSGVTDYRGESHNFYGLAVVDWVSSACPLGDIPTHTVQVTIHPDTSPEK